MKRFLIFVFFLVAISCAVLYFGWVNIKPGYFGIAVSTVTGTRNYPLQSGKFHWLWEKLIPKTFKLYLVDKKPDSIKFEYSTLLPGGENLKEYGDFEVSLEGSITYTIDFDAAKLLIDRGIFENQYKYFKDLVNKNLYNTFSNILIDIFKGELPAYSEEPDYYLIETVKNKIVNNLINQMKEYHLKNIHVALKFTKIPPINVYTKAIKLYLEFLDSLYRYKKEKLKARAELEAQLDRTKSEVEQLREYGKLIAEYPDILKYLYIKKLSDKVEVVVLPEGKDGLPSFLEKGANISKKNFIPIPEVPEKVLPRSNIPEEGSVSNNKSESQESFQKEPSKKQPSEEMGVAGPGKKKWYEYLMFWKYLGKKTN